MPDLKKETEQFNTIPKDTPAPEQNAPPWSAYPEELLRRNAGAESNSEKREHMDEILFRE